MQWSQNERLLKIDAEALRYYQKVPKDFNHLFMASEEINKGKYKPKFSISLDMIDEIGELTDDERKKLKKNFVKGIGAFKIVFDKDGMV